MAHIIHHLETDVLVVGAGLAGCWAAIRAKQSGADVILLDKGGGARTSTSALSCGDIKGTVPGDDLKEWIEEVVIGGHYLGDQRWIEIVLSQTYPRVLDMESFGVIFEKEKGGFKREVGRGKKTKKMVCNPTQMMVVMEEKAKALGVQILHRVFLFKLFGSEERVTGALGIHTRNDDVYIFTAKAVILAAGGCSFRHAYYGYHFATGDSYAMAYHLGAQLMNFEFAGCNTSARDFGICGMSRFVGFGGVFKNRLGEPFMEKYDSRSKDRTQLTNLTIAMAKEVREGRGPIFFDLTAITPEKYALSRKLIPWSLRAFDKAGVDIRTEKNMEWVPAFFGVGINSAGIKTDFENKATVDGLYACGDAWASTLNGAGQGFGGLNLAGCCVAGFNAGENAAKWAKDKELLAIDPADIEQSRSDLMQIMSKKKGCQPDDLEQALQDILIPYDILILRHGVRLETALKRLHAVSDEAVDLYASDRHGLIKVLELRNMLLCGEMILRSALLRTESRGSHLRDDYPNRDNDNWLKWTVLQKRGNQMELRTEPIPGEAFKYFEPA